MPLEVGVGMSLDEAAEERAPGIHSEVGDAVRALTTIVSSMRDIVALVGKV